MTVVFIHFVSKLENDGGPQVQNTNAKENATIEKKRKRENTTH